MVFPKDLFVDTSLKTDFKGLAPKGHRHGATAHAAATARPSPRLLAAAAADAAAGGPTDRVQLQEDHVKY